MVRSWSFLVSTTVGAGLLAFSKGALGYSGRMTWFTSEATMCGESGFSNSDLIVAINAPDWNNSCHRYICISYGGRSARARVIDQCGTCPSGAIDGSQGLFQVFADLDVGILNGVQWDYCDDDSGSGSGATSSSAARTSTQLASPSPSPTATTTTEAASATSSASAAAPSEAPESGEASEAGELTPEFPAVEDRNACFRDQSGSAKLHRRNDMFLDVPIISRSLKDYPMSESDFRKRGITPGVDEALEKRLKKRAEDEL